MKTYIWTDTWGKILFFFFKSSPGHTIASDTSGETVPQPVRQLALKEKQLKIKRLYAKMKIMK